MNISIFPCLASSKWYIQYSCLSGYNQSSLLCLLCKMLVRSHSTKSLHAPFFWKKAPIKGEHGMFQNNLPYGTVLSNNRKAEFHHRYGKYPLIYWHISWHICLCSSFFAYASTFLILSIRTPKNFIKTGKTFPKNKTHLPKIKLKSLKCSLISDFPWI